MAIVIQRVLDILTRVSAPQRNGGCEHRLLADEPCRGRYGADIGWARVSRRVAASQSPLNQPVVLGDEIIDPVA
jgi:hypothetical protein